MTQHDLKSGTDVRGQALGDGALITPQLARSIGYAFSAWAKGQLGFDRPLTISLGRDSRLSGPALLADFAQGVADAGHNALDFGLCTTPAMYRSLHSRAVQADAAVMVTASHHPWDRNGFKFFLPAGGINAKQLDQVLALLDQQQIPAAQPGSVRSHDFLADYRRELEGLIRRKLDTDVARPLLGLHVLVDAGNGAGGFYAQMLDDMGAWTEGSQFLEPDGTFPNHIPNPEDAGAMRSVSEAVMRHTADMGVIFDADCDRSAVVDHTGLAINRNRLIALVAAVLLDEQPGITIVTDSVTSTGLTKFIGEWGGEHYRYKRGYRNVIDEAIVLNQAGVDCPLAIETSGHAALRENDFLDDGMYLATLLVCKCMQLKQQGKTLSMLLDGLQEPVESVELRLPITQADFRPVGMQLIEHVIDYATNARGWHIAPDNREGVRISFDLDGGRDNAWFLLRMSVHDPVLPLNVESDVPGGVRQLLQQLLEAVAAIQGVDFTAIRQYIQQHDPSK